MSAKQKCGVLWRVGALLSCLACLIFLLAIPAVHARKNPPSHPIDLNAANEKELEELPGVGPTTAQAIINFREKSGRFKRVEDLLTIRGISEAKLQKMRPYLTVGPVPAAPAAAGPKLTAAHSTAGSATRASAAGSQGAPKKTQ